MKTVWMNLKPYHVGVRSFVMGMVTEFQGHLGPKKATIYVILNGNIQCKPYSPRRTFAKLRCEGKNF